MVFLTEWSKRFEGETVRRIGGRGFASWSASRGFCFDLEFQVHPIEEAERFESVLRALQQPRGLRSLCGHAECEESPEMAIACLAYLLRQGRVAR